MLTREMINKDDATSKFAEHFKTKNSIKNLLKKVPNAKTISTLFEDEKYGVEILGYSNLEEQFDIVMKDVFALYTAQVTEWREEGNNRPLPARVDLLKDLLSERMKKAPGSEIAASLGDFMKSATGKEVDKILKDAGIEDTNSLYLDVLTWVAARSIIIRATVPVEKVEGEIVVENAGHTATKKEPKEIVVVESTKENKFDKVIELITGLDANVSDDEILRVVSIIKPFIPELVEEFSKKLDEISAEACKKVKNTRVVTMIRKELPEKFTLKGIDVNKLIAFVGSMDFGTGADVMVRNLFFIIVDTLRNLDNDEKLYETAKFIIKMLKCCDNESAFVEELLMQSSRVNDIIKELSASGGTTTKTSSTTEANPVVQGSKPAKEESTGEYQMTADEKEFAEKYASERNGNYTFGMGIGKLAASYIRRPATA